MKKIKPIFGRLTGKFGNDSPQLLSKVRRSLKVCWRDDSANYLLSDRCFNSESLYF